MFVAHLTNFCFLKPFCSKPAKVLVWRPEPAAGYRGGKLGYIFRASLCSGLCLKGGPLPVENGVLTPISRVCSPQLPIYFRTFIGAP